MRSISSIIAFLIISVTYGQKLKKKEYYADYLRPPKSEIQITRDYSWVVFERAFDKNFRVVESKYRSGMSHYGRGDFFASVFGIGKLPGFNTPQGGDFSIKDDELQPSSLIHFKVGEATVLETTPGTNGKMTDHSIESGAARVVNIRVHIPLDFDMRFTVKSKDENRIDEFTDAAEKYGIEYIPVYRRNENAQSFSQMYQFPKDYKPFKNMKGYSTQAQADAEFSKYRVAFIKQIKDAHISDFLYKTKLELESEFAYAVKSFPINFYHFKDKEGNYADIEMFIEAFKRIKEKLDANLEANNRLNWFMPDIQSEIEKQLLIHENYLSDTSHKLPLMVEIGLRYNCIWLNFMRSDFAASKTEILFLNNLRTSLKEQIVNSKNGEEKLAKNELKIYEKVAANIRYFKLDEVTEFINDFEIRYQLNSEKLGWN